MSDEIAAQAALEVAEARRQSETYAIIAAVLAAQQSAAQAVPAPCQHAAPAPRRTTGQTAAIVGGVMVGGVVLTGMFLAIALTAIAIGIGGVVMLLLIRELKAGRR